MSIIHDALKRHERGEAPALPPPPPPVASVPSPPWLPAAIGGGGVLLAAAMTYMLTRPDNVVVVPVPVSPAPAAQVAVAPPAEAVSPQTSVPPGYIFQPVTSVDGTIPATGSPSTPTTTSPPATPVPPIQTVPVTPSMPPGLLPPDDFRNIPVYHGVREGEPTIDLPPDAVTIEMSNARIESISGGVAVNGSMPQPGVELKVGSEVRTGPNGAATLGFRRANVDLTNASAARITRLERHSTTSGNPAEEVTVHLAEGAARTVVRPGDGTVLVSTDKVTAATQSGAFNISNEQDGSVRVRNEGGLVKLVPTERPNETYILRNGEEVIYRNGQWVKP